MLKLFPIYAIVLVLVITIALAGSRVTTVMTENSPLPNRQTVIIDAGHGGIDGGATSVTGFQESAINLEISARLNDLLHFLGIRTRMLREDDRSLHTAGNTIAEKKVSDLKYRVNTVNQAEKPLLLSIHQNYFSDGRYSGAQVFYGINQDSKILATQLQTALAKSLNPGSKRLSKPAENVYLMQHINCPGVLIECGFLSNPQEEAKLRSPDYQKKLACVIAAELSKYLSFHTAS